MIKPAAPRRQFRAAPAAAWQRLLPNTRGALFMICAAISATCMLATVKLLGGRIDSVQVVFVRALFGVLVAFPVLVRPGGCGFRTDHLRLQVGTGVLGAIALVGAFFALARMDLTGVTVVLFLQPIFLLLLAMLFLGEAMHGGRWLATLVGFLGVLVIVKPAGIVAAAALAVIVAAFLSASMAVLIKKMSNADGPDIQLFYYNLTMAVVLVVPTFVVWTTPSWTDLALMIMVGVFGAAFAAFNVFALRAGEATAVSPFDYTRLIFAALIGFVLFSEMPDAWFWLGSAMIIAANLYILRSRRIRKTDAAA